MPPAQELMNDPVTFMQNSIVVVGWHGRQTTLQDRSITQSTVDMWLHKASKSVSVGRKKDWKRTGIPVYQLRPSNDAVQGYTADPEAIKVYFCPFRTSGMLGTVISNQATLFFTTQMDGCSLGVGSETQNGERLVFHANYAFNTTSVLDQSRNQLQELQSRFHDRPFDTHLKNVFGPESYRESRRGTQYASTTFGVRTDTKGWQFYTQRFARDEKGRKTYYTLKEVRPLFV